MKNILQIMDYAAPYRGNFIPSIECLEKHWTGKGNVVYLFPSVAEKFDWVQDLIHSGKRIYFIDRSFFSRKIKWSNIQQLNAIVLKENIEVIHTHFVINNYSLFLFSKLINKQSRIVSSLHNHYEPSGRMALVKMWIMKHTVDLYVGVSESVSQSALVIGVPKSKVITVKNAIEFNRFEKYDDIDIKKGNDSAVIIYMLGHTWHRKGVDLVVKAIDEIYKEFERPIILAITMAGCVEEAEKAIVDTLGFFPNWIEFLPPREDLATYYNAADIFISASREEGFSYALVEAAYCNPLLISSNIPAPVSLGIPFIELFTNESIVELKTSLLNVLNTTTIDKEKIKNTQRSFVQKQYDLNDWAKKMIKCYI